MACSRCAQNQRIARLLMCSAGVCRRLRFLSASSQTSIWDFCCMFPEQVVVCLHADSFFHVLDEPNCLCWEGSSLKLVSSRHIWPSWLPILVTPHHHLLSARALRSSRNSSETTQHEEPLHQVKYEYRLRQGRVSCGRWQQRFRTLGGRTRQLTINLTQGPTHRFGSTPARLLDFHNAMARAPACSFSDHSALGSTALFQQIRDLLPPPMQTSLTSFVALEFGHASSSIVEALRLRMLRATHAPRTMVSDLDAANAFKTARIVVRSSLDLLLSLPCRAHYQAPLRVLLGP